MLGKYKKQEVVESVLNKTDAMKIYQLFLDGKNHTQMFVEDRISFNHSEQVKTEMIRLENEMVSKMNGVFLLTEATYKIDKDENRVIDKAAEYFKLSSETILKNSISSDLLTVSTVVTDIRKWSDGSPDDAPKWATYKTSFN